jgi:hypothetical protein
MQQFSTVDVNDIFVFRIFQCMRNKTVCVPRSHVGWVASGTFLQVQRRHNKFSTHCHCSFMDLLRNKRQRHNSKDGFCSEVCVCAVNSVCVSVCELRLREIERRESITQAIDLESA